MKQASLEKMSSRVLFDALIPVQIDAHGPNPTSAIPASPRLIKVSVTEFHQQQQHLEVRLSDDSDPFFLYDFRLDERGFHALKHEQNLLVDFRDFSMHFVQLLQQVHQATGTGSPNSNTGVGSMAGRLVCRLVEQTGQLSLMETNAFKYILHLSLSMHKPSPDELRQYLHALVTHLKSDLTTLEKSYAQQEEDKRRITQEKSHLRSEMDQLRMRMEEQVTELMARRERDLAELCGGFDKERQEMKRMAEQEKRDATQQLSSRNKELEESLERVRKELAEMGAKQRVMEDELGLARQSNQRAALETKELRDQVDAAQRDKRTLVMSVEDLKRDLDSAKRHNEQLERAIKEKEALVLRLETLADNKTNQSCKMEQVVSGLNHQIAELERKLDLATSDSKKADEIIAKLSTELKSQKSKLKLKNVVALQQEKLIEERDATLSAVTKDRAELQESLSKKDAEVQQLRGEVDEQRRQLDELKKTIGENNNVIEWLHKQLNDGVMHRGGGTASGGGGGMGTASHVLKASHRVNQQQLPPRGQQQVQKTTRHQASGSTAENVAIHRAAHNLLQQQQRPVNDVPPRSNYF